MEFSERDLEIKLIIEFSFAATERGRPRWLTIAKNGSKSAIQERASNGVRDCGAKILNFGRFFQPRAWSLFQGLVVAKATEVLISLEVPPSNLTQLSSIPLFSFS